MNGTIFISYNLLVSVAGVAPFELLMHSSKRQGFFEGSIQRAKVVLRSVRQKVRAEREAMRAFRASAGPPLLVYQMGKVGSTTVTESLRSYGNLHPLQLHFLSPALEEVRDSHLKSGRRPAGYVIDLGFAVRRQLQRNPGRPIRVITLVRDPIAWQISNLFENPIQGGQEWLASLSALDAPAAVAFVQKHLLNRSLYDFVYNWFDQELRSVFGLDVLAEAFDKEQGFRTYQIGNCEALLIRLEDLDEKGPVVLHSFLQLSSEPKLVRGYDRETRGLGSLYREIKKQVRLDPALCAEVYSSRWTKHFYSEKWIAHFLERWTKGTDQSAIGVARVR